MLAGCITIAAKGGGVDGVIVDGENGFLSEEGNATELTDTIDRINHMAQDNKLDIRKNAIRTAITFSDTCVSMKYLDNVINNRGQ